ncbi:hypothetical protein M3C74_10100 [Micrococcus lylae]|uniref:hypothetical protein n=1 Tax=Micrococcus lylae TaxID=1273 RepID=UPI0021A69327|nr:hypothetical protein [Micrococcus lylae]MCT2008257.1 hypothetical protein [Micrococcus lylae]MCT2072170.1 hypothetical protein [Micrococcus lylae]
MTKSSHLHTLSSAVVAPTHRLKSFSAFAATMAAAALALSACAGGDDASDADATASASQSASQGAEASGSKGAEESKDGEGAGDDVAAASSVDEADWVDPTAAKEVATVKPRILLSDDEGLTLLDAETGDVLKEQALAGFKRLSNAGNGKDIMVITEKGWEVFSTGIKKQAHGDHFHNYESEPGMTGVVFPGDHAGHVVTHNGKTNLFADGTGSINTFISDDLDKATPDLTPVTEDMTTDAAHHGVALELADGSVLTTEGNEDERHTVKVVDREGKEIAKTEDCPGVHGEAAAQQQDGKDVVVLGCENGPIVYRDGEFHKIDPGMEFQRSGNLAGSDDSSIVLGDYKVEKEPKEAVERTTKVALIDSVNDSMKVVDLGSSYWFRSLARGPEGEGVVLTYDGKLNVIDEESGEVVKKIDAIGEWEEKDDWQEPGPILKTAGDFAYVTDAENNKLVVIDLVKGEKVDEFALDGPVTEMAVVTGAPEAPASSEGDDHGHDHGEDGHDHEGHDHGEDDHDHEGHDHGDDGHEHGDHDGHDHGDDEGHDHGHSDHDHDHDHDSEEDHGHDH